MRQRSLRPGHQREARLRGAGRLPKQSAEPGSEEWEGPPAPISTQIIIDKDIDIYRYKYVIYIYIIIYAYFNIGFSKRIDGEGPKRRRAPAAEAKSAKKQRLRVNGRRAECRFIFG